MKKSLLSMALLAGCSVAAMAGTGTAADPYTVDDVIALGKDASKPGVYVQGYIVGYAEYVANSPLKGHFTLDDGSVNPSNILLAGTSSETDAAYCIPVQLVASTTPRTALNLKDHPQNLGHEVLLQGDVAAYFGVAGFKNTASYKWIGEAPGGDDPVNIATGSAEKPLTVAEFLAQGTPATAVANTYVKGVIIGYVPGMKLDEAVFGTTGEVSATNILIGEAGTTSVSQAIPVQLPTGDIRAALNLKDNPGNLGKTVTLCGSHEKYFGGNGLKSVSSYAWDGEVIVPPTPVNALWTSLNETDAECDWTFDNVKLTGDLTYVFSWKTYNEKSYLNASAYMNNANLEAEAWAISPVADLTAGNGLKVQFQTAAKFQNGNLADEFTFYAREEGATEWTQLTVPTYAPAGSWTFTDSGEIDLSAFDGKKVQFAFKYLSTTAGADTVGVKNLKVTGNTSGVAGIETENGEAIYFNLQGVQVANPENGIYVKVQNGKAVKVAL